MPLIQKLNIHFNLQELKEYYHILNNDYKHRFWSTVENKEQILPDILKVIDPAASPNGWALQDYKDKLIPPWDIVKGLPTDARRPENNELVFGVTKRITTKLPMLYRLGLSVSPPGSCIEPHADGRYRFHIPIDTSEDSIFVFYKDFTFTEVIDTCRMPADGSAYLMNAHLPHSYHNNSKTNTRIHLLSFIDDEDIPDLLNICGHI